MPSCLLQDLSNPPDLERICAHYWHLMHPLMHLSLLSSDYCLAIAQLGVTSALVKTQTQRVHCLLYVFLRRPLPLAMLHVWNEGDLWSTCATPHYFTQALMCVRCTWTLCLCLWISCPSLLKIKIQSTCVISLFLAFGGCVDGWALVSSVGVVVSLHLEDLMD